MNKDRMKILSDMIKSYNTSYFSIDWIMKILDMKRNEIRMCKIKRLFNEE